VAAALCWAALDVVRKALAGKASPTALAVFLLLMKFQHLHNTKNNQVLPMRPV